ncbi:hypothetical protein DSECCO2_396910 [anaerobic digester metagenome]
MKSVMLSIRPQWCELIASGKKTIEVRKSHPKLETPFKCYIYCTIGGDALCPPHVNSPKWDIHRRGNGTPNGRKMTASERDKSDYHFTNGKVIGEFVCDSVMNFFGDSRFWLDEKAVEQTCLTGNQIREYANGKDAYGWHISALQIYDKPKELSEFFRATGEMDVCANSTHCETCEHWRCVRVNSEEYDMDCDCGGPLFEQMKPITRPFQSWGYVEELI